MDFSDYFGDPDPIVQEMAQNLDSYKQQLQSGSITQDEYNDLVNDVTSVNSAVVAGKTVSELEILDEAIAALKDIAAAVPIP